MCGIAGKLTAGPPVDPELLGRMRAALEHRGPDGEGTYLEGAVGLTMRRLAVIDLVHGDQPISSEDGRLTLVFNGEIYNHEELRRELRGRGHSFGGGSDAEVIVHLWEELGSGALQRLRGMFAFALWDARERELVLARDRVGKKPLYYTGGPGGLAFGSEPRAILQDEDVSRDIDPEAIDAFLACGYVPHDRCAFSALRKLPPASALRWRPGAEPVVWRWWRLRYEPRRKMGLEEAGERLREQLLEATRIRLRSDVPVGAFLSGGLDSSTVVAAMARVSDQPVRTFSVRFPGEDVDESEHALAVAQWCGTEHQELDLAPLDADLLPRVAWHFGEPFADPAALATFQLSQATRRHVTVALTGDGGDEGTAGYRRYWQLAATRPAEAVPPAARARAAAALRRLAGGVHGREPLPRAARLARRLALPPPRRYADLMRHMDDEDRRAVYSDELRARLNGSDPMAHVERAWNAWPGLPWRERAMAADLDTYLSDDLNAKADVTSMAHGLELRSPLLDHEVLEFCARLPPGRKLRGRQGKLALREAARPWLPADIVDRPKHGFALPLQRWLRDELRDLPEELLLDPRARDRGLLEPTAVARLVTEHRAGRDHGLALWTLMSLEVWFRTCVDRVVATPGAVPAL